MDVGVNSSVMRAPNWRRVKWLGRVAQVRSPRARPAGHAGEAVARVKMPRKRRFVLCVRRGTHKVALEPRKVYRIVNDPRAEARSLPRVIDESGEDYLFPVRLFVSIELPVRAMPAFTTAPLAAS